MVRPEAPRACAERPRAAHVLARTSACLACPADLHHQRPKGNYGLYFTFWDQLMGTEHADYEQQVAEHARTESRDGLAVKRLAYVSMASGIGLGVWSSL
jgi:hypothetical protein